MKGLAALVKYINSCDLDELEIKELREVDGEKNKNTLSFYRSHRSFCEL